MAKRRLAWRDMSHDHELLLEEDVWARSLQTKGPIPEFLAKKRAEQEPKTADWHQEALTQLWGFFEEHGFTTVGDFTERNVNLFRVHLRSRKLSENTVANRMRSIKAFARWMDKAGWTEDNRLADMRVPQSTKPQFELIPPVPSKLRTLER